MDRKVVDPFVIRPAAKGFRIVDSSTGQTAVIAMTPQDEMSEADAVHTAKMLNARAAGDGGRAVE